MTGELEFAIESGINIVDDVLQETLSRASSDEGMKNIVATIQRDQNAIIRDDDAHTLVIQGVAGSGKTSIALHRIAYPAVPVQGHAELRRHPDHLAQPRVRRLHRQRPARARRGAGRRDRDGGRWPSRAARSANIAFRRFFEQTALLLERNDEALNGAHCRQGVAGLPGVRSIAYVEHLEAASFVSRGLADLAASIVPDGSSPRRGSKHRRRAVHRARRDVVTTRPSIRSPSTTTTSSAPTNGAHLREAVREMARRTTLREAYRGLFGWMGKPELFKPAGGRLEYADVFPLIYLKLRLEGVDNHRKDVKHLLIDEMQDYTPVQYAVLGQAVLLPQDRARRTFTSSVDPQVASSVEGIRAALRSAIGVRLTKSFRSTWEIMQFALRIRPDPDLEPMARHGDPPRLERFSKRAGMVAGHRRGDRGLPRLGPPQPGGPGAILPRRPSDASTVTYESRNRCAPARRGFGLVLHRGRGLHRLSRQGSGVRPGRGPGGRCRKLPDRHGPPSLLYIACTRAMHRLAVFAVGELSPLLSADPEQPVEAVG
ncbi:MAG: helicase [Gammaproteobacteria bacterium]|nr:helicase [Gammaproteobacteria bacterium]